MPRYFFDIKGDGYSDPDEEGTDVADFDVRQYAKRVVEELREGGDYDDPSLILVVKDAGGTILFSIPFVAQGRRQGPTH
jgi:hypothetical protein